jgi:hypothetical protein
MGSNGSGTLFRTQRGMKYVENLTVALLEDDSGFISFNGDNDKSSFSYDALAPALGPTAAPGKAILFGGNKHYDAHGGTQAHASPAKFCTSSIECSPLKCLGSVCRQ